MAKNTKELKELSVAELDKKLRDTRDELLKARLNKQTGQLEKPHLLKQLRREIARVQTFKKQKATA
ncbi:MAG: 50S ribosomal protein L29 [Verrucomicrobia bacterium]|nr:50S ribosomal protein L29 [Verrucomicrobiota bacterium]